MIQNNKQRKVKDTIHKFICFSEDIWKIVIDTPHFQRLRHIKQLGSLQKVFPTATHTSFQHSLGVGHLAKKYIETLIDKNPESYKGQDTELIKLSVTLAGLLRNINYQPFSHIDEKYNYEPSAQMIIDAIYKESFKNFWPSEQGAERQAEQKAKYLAYRVKLLISGQKFLKTTEDILKVNANDNSYQEVTLMNRYLISFFLNLSKEQRKMVQNGFTENNQRRQRLFEISRDLLVSDQRDNLILSMELDQSQVKLLKKFISFLNQNLESIFRPNEHQNMYNIIKNIRKLDDNRIQQLKVQGINQQEFLKRCESLGSPYIFNLLITGIKQKQLDQQSDLQSTESSKILRIFRQLERPWQLDIINNKKHGIDVNLFESIRRDAFNLGADNIDVDYELLMKEARIVDGEICYPTKYADTVFNLFQARYKLHKNYYNNVFSVAFEQMIQEVFSLVKVIMSKTFCDPKFDLKKGDNLEKKTSLRLSNFLQFTDNVLDRIQDIVRYNHVEKILQEVYDYQNAQSQEMQREIKKTIQIQKQQQQEKFDKACQLIKRINKRDIYLHQKELTFICKSKARQLRYKEHLKEQIKRIEALQVQQSFKKKVLDHLDKNQPLNENESKKYRDNKEKIRSYIIEKYDQLYHDLQLKQQALRISDIKIAIHDIGFGFESSNPLDEVGFFSKYQKSFEKTKIPNSQLSMLYTDAYNELSIRIYLNKKVSKINSKTIMKAISQYKETTKLNQSPCKTVRNYRRQPQEPYRPTQEAMIQE